MRAILPVLWRDPHLLTLALEAHNPARNHHRAYVVEVGQDLLHDWVVTVHFGRAARPGRVRVYTHAVPDLDAAKAFVRRRLRRRLSAPKRLGCHYRLTHAVLDPGEELAAWVPPELLGEDIVLSLRQAGSRDQMHSADR